MRKHYALIFACLISASRLLAQDSLKTTMLNEVVTTAARYDQYILETPRSVTVINRDVIEKSVYNSVGELLSSQSGIYVVGANQTPGTNQGLFMRGANSNQVAVMVDGARLTDPSTPNATIDLNELSLTDVERIEIIRGSHSTLYGGGAVGGVVNIITKKGAGVGFHGAAGLQGGTFGNATSALSENVALNYMFKNGLYINGSIFNQNVKGLNASLDTLPKSGTFTTVDKDDFRKTDVYVKTGFKNPTWDGFITYKKIDQRADIDDGVFNDDDNAFLAFERNLVNYQVGYQVTKNWRVTALGSWSNSERLSLNDSSIIDEQGNYNGTYVEGRYKGKIMTNEIQLSYQYQKLKGVVGAGQYRDDMNFNTYYFGRSAFGNFESRVNYDTLDTSAKTNYAFGQVNFTADNFNFSVGTRLSNHSLFGNHWTFEANPSYHFNNTLLYASVSAGFNPASLYQLYDPTKGFNAYTTRGNQNLKPEESLSLELGIKKEFQNGSHITLSAYRTETKNAIEYIYLWDKNTNIDELSFSDNLGDTYLNIAKQVVNGLEVEGAAVFGKFQLLGNITWLKGKITISPSDIDAQQTGGNHVQLFNYGSFVTDEVKIDKLVRRPAFTAYAELSYKLVSAITFSTIYRYAGSRFDSGYDENLGPYGALNQFEVEYYNLIDIAARWQINKAFSIGIKVENILDENYREIIGFQTRGRSGYIKLNFRW
jgi:vitamin B12 transporter